MMRTFFQLFSLLILLTGVAPAAEVEHHALAPQAPVLFTLPLPGGIELPFSNAMLMMVCCALLIAVIVWCATRKMSLIPNKLQNVIEFFFEKLYNFVEGLIGPKLAQKHFWYFGTVFTLILVCNYMGLLPGVGILTYTDAAGQTDLLFRGANADMNVTMFLGLLFAILWLVWSLQEQGVKHFILHLFGPKGNLTGFLGIVLVPIFLFVGVIECLSIAIRPIALAARLYGNVFAGESIIETMSVMQSPWLSWIFVLPFMLMELLIGFIQALVFLLLTSIFLKLQVGDGDDHEEHASQKALEDSAVK